MTERLLGEYVVRTLLGRGGMAEVWDGYDPDLERRVAIKVILPHLSDDPAFGDRFRREARLIASMRHPHIVQLYDFDIVDGQAIMVMEYLPGGTLRGWMKQQRDIGSALYMSKVAADLDIIAGALDYAHDLDAIHRDLKPSNILFTAAADPVIGDFGIAKIVGESSGLTAIGEIVGTPAYMSPEQASGGDVDRRSDLYSLGIMLYEQVAGRVPFSGDTPAAVLVKHLKSSPPAPSIFNPGLVTAVDEMLLHTLEKDPAARFPTALALAQAFRVAAGVEEIAEVDAMPTVVEFPGKTSVDAVDEEKNLTVLAVPAKSAQDAPTVVVTSDTAQSTGTRWLVNASKVVAFAAPLVGYDAPDVENSPRDRRSVIIALMAAIGIFFAALQFALDVFDLVNSWTKPLVGVLPYLAGSLLVGGAILSCLIFLRATTRSQRFRASALLAVIVVVGAAWGSWWAYGELRPARGFVILVGDFDPGRSSTWIDFAVHIVARLQGELTEMNDVVEIVRAKEVFLDSETALQRGAEQNATVVIWGSYDDHKASPHIAVLDIPDFNVRSSNSRTLFRAASVVPIPGMRPVSPSALPDISRYVRDPMVLPDVSLFEEKGPQEMAYIASAVLGIGFYANGDIDRALELLDKAVANAGALEDFGVLGQELVYFHRGVIRYDQGHIETAIADLEKAAAIRPDLAEAHSNLAVAYANHCNPAIQIDRAIQSAETAVDLRPDSAAAYQTLGALYLMAKRYQQAADALETALEYDADDAWTYELLARVLTSVNQPEAAQRARGEAIERYRDVVASRPDDPVAAHLDLGNAYLSADQLDEALVEFSAAEAVSPDTPSVYRGLGNVHYWQGNRALAIAEYERWIELASNDADAYLLLGIMQSEEGDLTTAIATLEDAARLTTCDSAPHLLLGGLYLQVEDLERSAAAYEQAVAIDPTYGDGHYVLGAVYYLQGQLDAAERSFSMAVSLTPESAAAYAALGIVAQDKGDYLRAVENFLEVLQLAPDDVPTSILLAHTYEAQGKGDKAIQVLQQVLKLVESVDLHAELANIYLAQDEIDNAISELERATALEPQRWLYHFQLGELNSQVSNLDEAEYHYRAAIDANANAAEAHHGLSLVAFRQCRLNDGIEAANQAVHLDGTSSVYRHNLAILYAAEGRIEEAKTILNDLLSTQGEDGEALLRASYFLYSIGDNDAAAGVVQQILEHNSVPMPVVSLAHELMGQLYYDQDKMAPARAAFEMSLDVFHANASAQAMLGDIAQREGDSSAALQAYDLAEEMLPGYSQVMPPDHVAQLEVSLLIRRALVLDHVGRPNDALEARAQALSRAETFVVQTPSSPFANLSLAWVYAVSGAQDEANRAYAAASQCDRRTGLFRARYEENLAKLRRP